MLTDYAKLKKHFAQTDPLLLSVLDTLDPSDWFEEEGSDYFASLARNIVFQQLAGGAASTIYDRFEKLVGEVKPDNLLAVPDDLLRSAGLSWAKVKYVKDLALKTKSGEVRLNNLHDLSDEEVIIELVKVKGIGRWTAEMFLLFTLHRENIFSFLDLGLKKGFSKLYGIENPTNDQIEQVISRWDPYKSYGSISLWHHLDNR